MKKFLKISAAFAMMLSASVAAAQNGSDVTGGTVSNTVGGIFVPTSGGTTVTSGGGLVITAPPATPVAINAPGGGGAATANVAAVTSGSPAAVAAFTQTLSTAGVPAAAAQGIASALEGIGSSPTVGSVTAAIATWNATIATLSPAQAQAFARSPAGRAAIRMMAAARNAAVRAR